LPNNGEVGEQWKTRTEVSSTKGRIVKTGNQEWVRGGGNWGKVKRSRKGHEGGVHRSVIAKDEADLGRGGGSEKIKK